MKKTILLLFVLFSPTLKAQNDELVKACVAGNLADVKALVDKGADVNYKNSPLMSAIWFPDVIQYLISKGAKPNEGDYPPLVMACKYGSPEVIKTLLDGGADPNKAAKTDVSASIQTALDAEKAKGKQANKYMIKAYEDMIVKMKSSPVITYAMTNLVTETNCLDCMKMMAEKGVKMDAVNTISGSTLLGDFATWGRSKKTRIEQQKVMADALVKYGMTVPDWYSKPDESKMATPDEIVKFLVGKGVNINTVNNLKNAPLMEALIVIPTIVQPEVIIALINNGADVKIESILYGKPMLIAAGNGQVDVMDALLTHGSGLNDEFYVNDTQTGQSLKGITPLMWAAKNEHLDAVKFLISKGVDLGTEAHGRSMNMKTKCVTKVEGKTAIYYAIESGNMDIVQALVETGHYWGKSFLTKEMKHEQDWGALTLVTCFEVGGYIPSQYAKALGYPEMQKYLKAKLI